MWTCGVDEVGRGPLAGPVLAAAVILDPEQPIEELCDSKKCSEKKRERLFALIQERAISIGLGEASVAEIDEFNILQASLLAMKRAVEALTIPPDFAYIDGNRCPEIACACEAIVKGDSKVASISAASIIAKVTRDRQMKQLDSQYPGYGFAKNSGYPTAMHREALKKLGPTPIHRQSFAPVRQCLEMVE